jgi:hypothetical protein
MELRNFDVSWNELNPESKWVNGAVFENINGLNWHEVSINPVPGKDEPAVIFNSNFFL